MIALAAAVAPACAASDAEVREARLSGYAADYAIVYSETLAAVRDLYPKVNENASAGTIKTAWHIVKIRTGTGEEARDPVQHDPTSVRSPDPTFQQEAIGRKQYFVRFSVAVIGGRPWRVRVEGEASSWDIAGGVPSPLKGAETPPWLEGRVNALQVAIHERLEKYAVRLQPAKLKERPKAKVDMAKYGNVPDGAAKLLAAVQQAALGRDPEALRAAMVDDFSWSAGSDPSADIALAMWQADTAILGELAKVLDQGCRVDDSQTLVTCPPAYTEEPSYGGYRAGFKLIDGKWKMSFFLSGD